MVVSQTRPLRARAVIPVALGLAALWGASPALAQRNIGAATSIERDVSGTLAGRNRTLRGGDGVFSNENIRTANASAAQLQFLDQTKLAIGPSASVVLDRFVYNPDGSARDTVIRIARGAARWAGRVTRELVHKVRTPHASIGARGTIFDVLVQPQRTIVTLREGVIEVCAIAAPQRCLTLDTPGQVVIVTPTTIEGPSRAAASETRFADLCLRPIDRSACDVTTTAELTPTLAPTSVWGGGFYAGVHGGGVVSRQRPVSVDGTAGVLGLIAAGQAAESVETHGLGAFAGAQAGYSWQLGPAMVGFEADVSALSARASGDVPLNPTSVCDCLTWTTAASQTLNELGTLRARAGITAGDLLAYGTAGLAVGHIKLDGSITRGSSGVPAYIGNRSLVRAGYVVGGGFEFALASPLSLRVEYLHYDLGKQTLGLDEVTGLAPGQSAVMQFRTRGDLVRAGINVNFDGWPLAAAAGHDALAYAGSVYKAPPPAPLFSWTGFYAGVHGGAGWARNNWFFGSLAGVAVAPGPEGTHVATGGLAGGQLGFNYQTGSWVWGVEADASWANLRGDNISTIFSPLVISTGPVMEGERRATVVDALGTIAARVGFAWDRTLLYGKVGGAWAHDKYRGIDLASGEVDSIGNKTRWGWVAGIGLERAFLENWSAKVEYDYMDFGNKHVGLNCIPGVPNGCSGTVQEVIRQNVGTIKAGINYRFGGPIIASY